MQFIVQCGVNWQIAQEIPERPPFQSAPDVCQLISCPRKQVVRYCLTMVFDYAREAQDSPTDGLPDAFALASKASFQILKS